MSASESSSDRVPLGEALACLRGALAFFAAGGLSALGLGAALGFEAAAEEEAFGLGAAWKRERKKGAVVLVGGMKDKIQRWTLI